MDALKQMWIDLLADRYSPRAIIERNEARVRDLEGLPRLAGVVYGQDPGEIVIEEGGVRFAVNLIEGQKTGAFLDQRENRLAAASYGRGSRARLLHVSGRLRASSRRGAPTAFWPSTCRRRRIKHAPSETASLTTRPTSSL